MDTIAAPLAAALADKGYESLTPVQNAVTDPALAGRDLLVSAQTGSGKTVAFGLAIAGELLSGDMAIAAAPRALVVAPTRELALQVRREMEWLYGPAGAIIASCVGGMDPRAERRALEKGATIVVGTPGRLRDHIDRRSLDLSDIRAVVLDEADEMLDLGFQDDLEFILSAAPESRRTLMFSATVPREIEQLAASYQRDAERVQVKGESRQHVDISYQAMNVRPRDKENAVINLLLLQQARVAIVFCKTRASVTHLHARMSNRGFKVVALSGELSQGERSHALQALRDGRANVCIATDVAARGIDLPGLDLVVHFDLPSNPETLLHRSGRTGRAGAKGTAVLIVPPSEARKANRILQGAKVEAEWINAPTAEEVQSADDARMLGADALLEAVTEEETALVEAILGVAGPEGAAAGFLRLWRAGRSAPEIVGDMPAPVPAEARVPRERGEFGPSVWFTLSVGHEGRAEARWLLPKLCDAGGITRNDIGAIRVQQRETFVQIGEASAARFAGTTELEEGLVLTRLAEAPDLSAPSRGPRPAGRFERSEGGPRKSFGAPREREYRERDGDERRPPRAPRAESAEGERRSYKPRPVDADAPARKPWPKREEGSGWSPTRDEDGERRPREFGDRKPRDFGDRKPYAPRDGAERKPYAPRDGGDRKPYGSREDGPRKPYAPREFGDRKPYAPRDGGDRKPYTPREDGERKPFARREEGDRKPYGAAKSFGAAKPRPAFGDKPRPAYGDKPRGSFGAEARPSRPAAPKPDFSDPSVSMRAKPRSAGFKGAPKTGGPRGGGFKPKR